MKVHVRTLDPTRRRVAFSSDLGAAEAGWLGDLPEADRDYHVEIAINERLVWGTDIVATPPAHPRIAQGPAGITLDATLESIRGRRRSHVAARAEPRTDRHRSTIATRGCAESPPPAWGAAPLVDQDRAR